MQSFQIVTLAKLRIKLGLGIVVYLLTGRTPAYAHQSMIRLFCLSGGSSNDQMSRVIGLFRRPRPFIPASGALGEMSGDTLTRVVDSLRTKGYHVFESRLPDSVCDALLAYATSQPCTTRGMDGNAPPVPENVVYNRQKPEAVRYEFSTRQLLENPDVQALLADPSFAAVAQEYLGARPLIDVLAMWWHTAFSDQPDKEAAQFFHFDMDRPKWLKFFIYLTDVDTTNGPHTFVAGSQRTGGIPDRLLRQGYARLSDEEVGTCYPPESIIEFDAPRGTIIAEDTRGLHKGKHVSCGDRLILQVQFSNSLFGSQYEKAVIGTTRSPALSQAIAENPELYAAYLG